MFIGHTFKIVQVLYLYGKKIFLCTVLLHLVYTDFTVPHVQFIYIGFTTMFYFSHVVSFDYAICLYRFTTMLPVTRATFKFLSFSNLTNQGFIVLPL